MKRIANGVAYTYQESSHFVRTAAEVVDQIRDFNKGRSKRISEETAMRLYRLLDQYAYADDLWPAGAATGIHKVDQEELN